MARGLQKEQSRQKAQEKLAKQKGGTSQLKTRAAGLKVTCPKVRCKISLADYNNFKEHFEAKHPKDPLPTPESLATA
ncbi:hypothetical protein MNV49_000825 [Pseudohyphozyma bogoriensis]|nr:hypothetical protein MNV49_000825 [Pseudohyphozyma bogoriensis]